MGITVVQLVLYEINVCRKHQHMFTFYQAEQTKQTSPQALISVGFAKFPVELGVLVNPSYNESSGGLRHRGGLDWMWDLPDCPRVPRLPVDTDWQWRITRQSHRRPQCTGHVITQLITFILSAEQQQRNVLLVGRDDTTPITTWRI
ncbi:hypothetical protein DPEC_G00010510 [Dallia pectoralis]|uniref:Uncharacterized protein n=1 Tax=Dallia pectoralis TaxID=75939 RepID=A0ACC2HLF6_DALPE|nr:hypothetical protein DPEC_G00010510 [Dallia pectoralis]